MITKFRLRVSRSARVIVLGLAAPPLTASTGMQKVRLLMIERGISVADSIEDDPLRGSVVMAMILSATCERSGVIPLGSLVRIPRLPMFTQRL